MTQALVDSPLRAFARSYGLRAVDDAPFVPLPLADQSPDDEEAELKARTRQLSYEMALAEWRAVDCAGEPFEAPRRFIDGSVFSRTVAVFTVDGRRRPAILACVGALALEMAGARLSRPAGSLRLETTLCLLSNGVPPEDLRALSAGLEAIGVRLVASETTDLSADFDRLRHRTHHLAQQRMEEAERDVLFDQPDVPAVVDGLLERRLATVASQGMPAYGVVKRHHKQYLPASHINFLYDLQPGQRTPAFLLETEHAVLVSWYLRLGASEAGAPGAGIVRITAPQEYLEQRFPAPADRWAQVSAVSAWLRGLRHREASYGRVAVSLEPIVRVEDELHVLLPSVEQQAARLHRALGV